MERMVKNKKAKFPQILQWNSYAKNYIILCYVLKASTLINISWFWIMNDLAFWKMSEIY